MYDLNYTDIQYWDYETWNYSDVPVISKYYLYLFHQKIILSIRVFRNEEPRLYCLFWKLNLTKTFRRVLRIQFQPLLDRRPFSNILSLWELVPIGPGCGLLGSSPMPRLKLLDSCRIRVRIYKWYATNSFWFVLGIDHRPDREKFVFALDFASEYSPQLLVNTLISAYKEVGTIISCAPDTSSLSIVLLPIAWRFEN